MSSMAKTVEKLYEIGAEAKRKIGEETDAQLLKAIKENSGRTPYYFAQELEWQVGRVDGSLRRLQKQGKVNVKYVLKHGRVVKKIYSSEYQAKHPSVVEILMKFRVEAERVNDSIQFRLPEEVVEFYGLWNSEVGLSTSRNEALLTVEATIIPITKEKE